MLKYDENDFPIEIDVPFHSSEDNEIDVAYFEILNIKHMMKINRLAAEFYSMSGRIFLPDMDFYASNHPEESGCFIRACVSFYLIGEQR